jgi:hypothetical protein
MFVLSISDHCTSRSICARRNTESNQKGSGHFSREIEIENNLALTLHLQLFSKSVNNNPIDTIKQTECVWKSVISVLQQFILATE